MNRGHTLLELAVVLSVLALVGTMGLGLSRRHVDRMAVSQAREQAVALLHQARAQARIHGGARVEIDSDGVLTLRRPPDAVELRFDPRSDRVRVEVQGARDEASVIYGPMGIGRAASLTLRFERGRSTTSLVVSSYGRVRRGP